MKLKTLTFILIVFLQSNFLSAQTKNEINNYFEDLHLINQFNGNYIIANNKKIIAEKSLGFSDLDKKKELKKNTLFTIASISKTFTATAILQLKQKGKLNLDDTVQKYLPNFPYSNVTVKHLLNHTSGLTDFYNLFDSLMVHYPEKLITNSDIIPILIENKTPLSSLPGERWEYNNVNYCILALIIEKISGQSFSEYIKQNIFKPAKMKNSIVPNNRNIKQKNQVEQYTYPNLYSTTLQNVKNIPEKFKILERSNFYGNGGIVSTTLDLYKYDQALYNGALLGKKELEEAFTPTRLNDGKIATFNFDDKEIAYGLGWAIYTDEKNGKTVFHDGFNTGLSSILVRNISKKQSVIILENTGSNVVFPASNAILNILNQQTYQPTTQNFARLYGSILVNNGIAQADKLLMKYFNNTEKYNVTEREMNSLGYQLLRNKKIPEALVIFNTTTKIYPNSGNAFDSYGEALLLNNQKEEAIKMYQRSVELNPNNENGKKILQQILNK